MGCIQQLNKANLKQLLLSVDNILTDCDGVLWHGNRAIIGVNETLQKLRKKQKKVFFVTNNSTKTRAQFAVKCQQLGFDACEDEIVGAGYVAARYIRHHYSNISRAFVIGSAGLEEELRLVGISHCGQIGPASPYTGEELRAELKSLNKNDAECVVVGYDDHFNYARLSRALAYLQNKQCLFVATNTDPTYPSDEGYVLPGTGSIVKCVETAAGREPDVICGKPHHPMVDILVETRGVDPARTLMIGDRLETDIAFAAECGFKSLAVLTGVCSLEEIQAKAASTCASDRKLVPDFYTASLADLSQLIDDD